VDKNFLIVRCHDHLPPEYSPGIELLHCLGNCALSGSVHKSLGIYTDVLATLRRRWMEFVFQTGTPCKESKPERSPFVDRIPLCLFPLTHKVAQCPVLLLLAV